MTELTPEQKLLSQVAIDALEERLNYPSTRCHVGTARALIHTLRAAWKERDRLKDEHEDAEWRFQRMSKFYDDSQEGRVKLRAERDQLRVEITGLEITISNLQSALVAAGHEPDCPVVHSASVDCVPGTCVDYLGLYSKAVAEAAALRLGLEDALPYLKYGHQTSMSLGGEPARIRFEYVTSAISNTSLAAQHLETDKRRDEALEKLATDNLVRENYCRWCRRYIARPESHEDWCPTKIAREAREEQEG